MRHLRLALMSTLLVLPFGCGGKTEEEKTKSPAKTENAAAKDSKDNTDPKGNSTVKDTAKKDAPRVRRPAIDVPPSDGTEYAMVPEGTIALFSVRPAAVLGSAFFQNLPEKEETDQRIADMKGKFGIDPAGVASVTIALWPGDGHVVPQLPQLLTPQDGGPGEPGPPREELDGEAKELNDCSFQPPDGPGGPGGGGNPIVGMIMNMVPKLDGAVFIKLAEPLDLEKLQENVPPLAALQPDTVAGKNVLVHPAFPLAGGASLYQPDPKTLVITFKDDLAEILNNKAEGELVKQAKAQGSQVDAALLLDFQPFAPLIQMAAAFASAQAPDANKILPNLKGTSFFVDWNDGVDVDVMVHAKDDQTAALLKQQFDAGTKNLEGELPNLTGQIPPGTSEESKAAIEKVGQNVYDSLKGEASGTTFHINLRVPETATDVINNVNEEQKSRMQGLNNLKQIGLACLNHAFSRGDSYPFPEASQLSWRVHILDSLDHGALYRQFKLDEAWDSPHNKALLEKMPDVYKLSDQTKPGYTQFVAPAGEGFIADGQEPRKVAQISDGTSNTIMVLSVKPEHAVPWTKPGGFKIDPAKASQVLGGQDGSFLALFADGSAESLNTNLDQDTIKALLTVAGGEVVDRWELSGDHPRRGFGSSSAKGVDARDDVIERN